ncbi:hypothetical protein [Aquimarina sp. I32.4]|uniref:hypothetical protein n=1 Tax=Aquimarina sp. I32.4 TaxID=2053903 RepID=UPI000CDE75A1|nr:hypothetical protein [Aquimarina sp. I32.4]
MLKGKKGLYVLLPLVAFIWGAIVFQVVGAFSDEDPVVMGTEEVSVAPIKTKERERFKLGVVERDPFLGTLYKPKKKKISTVKVRVKKTVLVWPSIQYKGVVSGQGNTNAIYLIEINNADQLIKLRQTISEVTLVKAFSSSVRLRYKGKTKDFKIVN